MLLTVVLLLLGFALLIKGADWLVAGASSIARRFGISELAIGLTVVAFGTSAPELFVNVMSAAGGNTGLALGNILGSNIANILLILGTASIICPLAVSHGTVWKEIPLSLLAAVLVGLLANDGLIDGRGFSELGRIDGLVMLAFFVLFLYYSAGIAKKIEGMDEVVDHTRRGTGVSLLMFAGGLAGLVIGGKLIVDSAVTIAETFGVSQALIGLSVVAVGTSLPELATSVVAARRGNVEIAVGNAVGSNIFNIFLILGITAVVEPIPIQSRTNIDVGMTAAASLLLFLTAFTGGRRLIERWEGICMVTAYVVYIAGSFLFIG